MIRKIFYRGTVVALCGLGVTTAVRAAELRGVQLAPQPAAAQLSLDLDEAVAPTLFTLEHPYRIVIDLRHTHRAAGVHAPAPGGAVSAVRFGVQPGGTLRVVIETNTTLAAHWANARGRTLLLNLGAWSPVAVSADPQPVHAVHAPDEGSRDVVIAVDAGHGGQDPGAIGHGGTREKDVTLAIARALAERIDAEPGMRAVLTRDRDEFLELRDRIRRARVARADMFVSVHADSIADRSITGASVYVLSVHGASSEAARWLAERENAADLMGGVRLDDKGSLAPVLLDATQSEIIGVSASAAERVRRCPRERRRSAQGAGAACRLRGAQVPGHPLDAGRDRLHLQPRGRAAPENREPAVAARRGDRRRRAQLLPAEPPRRHALQAAAARKPGQRRRRLRRGGNSLDPGRTARPPCSEPFRL